jgi:hypothetical protein
LLTDELQREVGGRAEGPGSGDPAHLDDPYHSVAADVELLRANPAVPRSPVVSGLVYDVDTGLTQTIVAPAPLHAS